MTLKELRLILMRYGHRTSLPAVSVADWAAVRKRFNCDFPRTFELLAEQTDYALSGAHLRPVGPDSMVECADTEKEATPESWDDDLVPIYAVGNGDLICLRASEGRESRVYHRDHEDNYSVTVIAESVDDWLRDPEWHS